VVARSRLFPLGLGLIPGLLLFLLNQNLAKTLNGRAISKSLASLQGSFFASPLRAFFKNEVMPGLLLLLALELDKVVVVKM
jgi:hypothetical protein